MTQRASKPKGRSLEHRAFRRMGKRRDADPDEWTLDLRRGLAGRE